MCLLDTKKTDFWVDYHFNVASIGLHTASSDLAVLILLLNLTFLQLHRNLAIIQLLCIVQKNILNVISMNVWLYRSGNEHLLKYKH